MTQPNLSLSARVEEARESDAFVLVRPALVRRLGNGNAAIVHARIEFRCNQPGVDRIEDENGRWWRVSMNILSDETGLTVDALRRTLRNLEKLSAIESRKHQLYGPSDQTLSYRIVPSPAIRSDARMESAELPNGSSTARSNARIESVKRPDHHSVKRPNVPPIEEVKEGVPSGAAPAVGEPREQEPPSRCSKHLNDPRPPNCGACGDARRARAAWVEGWRERTLAVRSAEARREAGARAQAIADCTLCDSDGYRGTSPCTHNPDQAETNLRGAALARAALKERRPA